MVKRSKREKRRARAVFSSASSVPTFSGSGPVLDTRKVRRVGGRDFGPRRSGESGGQGRRRKKELGFRDAWVSVQAMGATQLRGWRRRKWEADAFEAIGGGAKLAREQKMPNKMRMGIMKKRKQKLARAQAEELKSDVVTGQADGKKKKGGAKRSQSQKRKLEVEARDPMTSRGVKFQGGVMHVQDIGGGGGGGRGRRR
jgi:hypothetical protein